MYNFIRMIIVAGGTGLIGQKLISELGKNDKIITITRKKSEWKENLLEWGEIFEEKWIEKLKTEREKIIINLAGENIGKIWTKATKKKILESRLNSTKTVVELAEKIKAQKLINASAIGYYGDTGNEEKDEKSKVGNSFLANVCNMWEQEAKKVESSKLYILRIGVVLDKKAKIISSSITPFFIVNPFGQGQNYISWIHIDDLIQVIKDIIEGKFEKNDKDAAGKMLKLPETVINCVSPNPVKANEFIKTISQIKKRKIISIPQIILELILGKDFVRETISISQRIRPSFLIEKGFKFKYPDIKSALENII